MKYNELLNAIREIYDCIARYLLSLDEEDYRTIRTRIDDIFKYQDIINKDYNELEDISYNDVARTLLRNYKRYEDQFALFGEDSYNKYSRYGNINNIFSKETNKLDLEKLLREDATSKAAIKYFDIKDDGMYIDDYLFYHDLPKENLSDEQSIIKNTIDMIYEKLFNDLKNYYFEIFQYVNNQKDFDNNDINDKITNIIVCKDRIDNIMKTYFHKNSSLFKYKDPNTINEDVYKDMLKFFTECHNSIDEDKAELYKVAALDIYYESEYDLYQLLKKDAYTDNAKRYFGLDIIEKEN